MSKKKQLVAEPPPILPRTGVESHAHLNGRAFNADFDQVIERAAAAGVAQIIQVFLSPEAWQRDKSLFDAHPHVFFILGIHPTEAHLFSCDVVEKIRQAVLSDTRIRAIGEIGLDFYWKECPPAIQKKFFIKQLALARQLSLPVVVHCRDAESETFALLETQGFSGYPLLWHCFGGDSAMAGRIVGNGWYLSVPGPVTFPANAILRKAVADVPEDRLLVETDSPYLSPIPLRGKRNEPANLGYTIAAMAEARQMAPADLWTICGNNARRFFGIGTLGT
ncbi:MAG: TatD family hydrolase [Desulfovibrio sp.]|jgi:TatD DNase family protein|nr:TatD family hydrolase [Desulfovibrio sp.]